MSSRAPDLSTEQRTAVFSTEKSLVVAAAAGSGKTRVLVERYLKHVTEDGFRADQILTITFTRKAAAEMKRRIVDRLNENGLPNQAQIAETGPIQTIHGFCERLLRENAMDAGLDPEFEILSESQAGRMMEEAIREVLAAPSEEAESSDLIRRLAGKRTYGESLSPHARLEQAIRKALIDLRGTGVQVERLEETHQSPFALQMRWREMLMDSVPPDVREAAEASKADSLASKLQDGFKQLKRANPLRTSSF